MATRRNSAAKKPGGKGHLRARVWVEVEGKGSSRASLMMSEAGADLLEQIEACGSLSEAARRLGFAYRRAWMLVDTMNRAWPDRLVETAAGGKRGGGARVTAYGRTVVAAYRDVQVQIEHAIEQAASSFAAATQT